jgi:hypothetical protein
MLASGAAAFARSVDGPGSLRAPRAAGRVDVAFAEYPLHANEYQVCLLVNGTPAPIDVDEVQRVWPRSS